MPPAAPWTTTGSAQQGRPNDRDSDGLVNDEMNVCGTESWWGLTVTGPARATLSHGQRFSRWTRLEAGVSDRNEVDAVRTGRPRPAVNPATSLGSRKHDAGIGSSRNAPRLDTSLRTDLLNAVLGGCVEYPEHHLVGGYRERHQQVHLRPLHGHRCCAFVEFGYGDAELITCEFGCVPLDEVALQMPDAGIRPLTLGDREAHGIRCFPMRRVGRCAGRVRRVSGCRVCGRCGWGWPRRFSGWWTTRRRRRGWSSQRPRARRRVVRTG